MRPTLDYSFFFFFNDTATTEIYTLSLHDALPISTAAPARAPVPPPALAACERGRGTCSATPRCGARSGSRAPDTRRRLRRARAGLRHRGAARRPPPRPSLRPAAAGRHPARPADARATLGTRAAPACRPPPRGPPPTRRGERPRPARPPAALQPSRPPRRSLSRPPTPSCPRQLVRGRQDTPARLLTQGGA